MKGKYLVALMLLYLCGTVCFAISAPPGIIYAAVIAVFIRIFTAKTKRSLILAAAFSLCFTAGYLHINLENEQYRLFEDKLCGCYVTVSGTVDGIPETVETAFGQVKIVYPVRLYEAKTDEGFYKTNRKITVTAPENAPVSIGDTVMLKGILKLPDDAANPGGFDYRMYLRTNDIAATMSLHNGVITGKKFSVIYEAQKLRVLLLEKISEFMPDSTDMLVRAILLGDKEILSDDVKDMFSGSGVSHALALSGMHLSILTAFMLWFISKTPMHIRLRSAFCMIVVILYILLAGFSPSLIRAGIMSLFLFGATLLKRRYDFLTAIVFAATLIVSENPFAIYSVSFQLSFAATAGIVFIGSPLYRTIRYKLQPGRFLSAIMMTVILSLTATVATLPIMARSFGSISLYTVLGNILVVPLIEILFGGGIIMLLIGSVSAIAAKVIGIGLAFVTKAIIFICQTISSLGGAFLTVKYPGIADWIFYISLIALIYCLATKPKKFKLPLISVVLSLLLCTSVEVYENTVFRVDFINVGQGDSALVHIPHGKNLLIDCGPDSFGEAASYIKSKGIYELDAIYLSHFDSDHSGGLGEVLSSVKVKKVVVSHTNAKNKDNLEILNKIIKSGTPVEFADDTYRENFGICEIKSLWPTDNSSSDDNNNSLVLSLSYKDKRFLFTGDINTKTEENIIKNTKNLDTDVLKVAHHGSKTSTGDNFVNKLSPDYAVISAARNNSYGHPDKTVVSRLENSGCRVFRTDLNGYVHFSQDMFGNFKIKTKNP